MVRGAGHDNEIIQFDLAPGLVCKRVIRGVQNFDADDAAVRAVVDGDIFGQALGADLETAFEETDVKGVDLGVVGNLHALSSTSSSLSYSGGVSRNGIAAGRLVMV